MPSERDSTEPQASEVGCQINLITGEHYGECRSTCGVAVKESGFEHIAQQLERYAQEMRDGKCQTADIDLHVFKQAGVPTDERLMVLELRCIGYFSMPEETD